MADNEPISVLLTTETTPEPIAKVFITPPGFKMAYTFVGIFGMLGNAMTIAVILYSPSLRKSFTNKFIINQSLIDFFSSFFILMTNLIRDRSPKVFGDGLAQEIWCCLWMTKWPVFASFMASTLNLVAMTYERYYAIVFPLHHSHSFNNKKAYSLMVATWICGMGWHGSYSISTSYRVEGSCKTFQYPTVTIRRAMAIIVPTVQFFIPIIAIFTAYVLTFYTLKQSSINEKSGNKSQDIREERMKRARKNVIRTLMRVFICFICCWTPNQIFFIGFTLGYDFTPDATFYHCSVLILFINSMINPVIYTLTYEQFQRAQLAIFCPRIIKDQEFEDMWERSKESSIVSEQTISRTVSKCPVSQEWYMTSVVHCQIALKPFLDFFL